MRGISPRNRTAQLAYEAVGNPPSAHPRSAISNAYPGLEMDFRNIWRHLFVGVELHEATNLVVGVSPDAGDDVRRLADGYRLLTVDGRPITVPVMGPAFAGGPTVSLPDTNFQSPTMALEWSNALADVVRKAGLSVLCVFQQGTPPVAGSPLVEVMLEVRHFFERRPAAGGGLEETATIDKAIAAPGELSQSLCSPWQNDYRECACFYWAASRPDYVNVEPRPDGTSGGNNWMQKDRKPSSPAVYIVDDWVDSRLFTHADLFTGWEKLSFVVGGRDEE